MASAATRWSLATAFLFLSLLATISVSEKHRADALLVPWISPYDDINPVKILEQTHFPTDTQTLPLTTMALARADWGETAKEHVITLDVPGVKKEDIKIEVEDNRVLRISGERKVVAAENEEEQKGKDQRMVWHRAERSGGKFWRRFKLPMNADLDNVKAHLEDGVLMIRVPKLAEDKKRQPKLVQISSSSSSAGQDIQATKAEL